MESLHTSESVKSTFPHYIGSISLHSKKLYIMILIIVFLLLFSLPFIKVNLYVKSSGIIRPGTEKTPVHSLISGKVAGVNFSESDRLKEGEIMVSLDRNSKELELEQLKSLSGQIMAEIHDLENLLSDNQGQMYSVKFRLEYLAFTQQSARLSEKLAKAAREKNRNESLFIEKLISEKEFDDLAFNVDQHKQELNHFIYMKQNQWQNELA